MLPEYALNMTSGKLHTANCYHARNCAIHSISKTFLPLFREYGEQISICSFCLKNDEKAKTAVDEWNHEFENYI